MGKKKFTDGLETLFGTSSAQAYEEDSVLLVETKVTGDKDAGSNAKKTRSKIKNSKNFTSDLDTLFQDVLKETIVEQVQKVAGQSPDDAKAAPRKRRAPRPRPLTGLDALIRQTIEGSEVEVSYERRKRITFTFEKEKIERLKKIAKEQKTYLKDIVGGIVTDYINKYEKKLKGNSAN